MQSPRAFLVDLVKFQSRRYSPDDRRREMLIFPPFYFGRIFYFGGISLNSKKINVKKMTVIAVLCAMAYICTFLLHFKFQFLTFDFKDAIIAISALIYGPVAGLLTSFIVAFLEFITVSDTGVYGLIMNFLSSAAFSVTAGLVYKYKRTFYGAIFAVVSAVFAVIAVMLLANIFITPFYMGATADAVINLIPTMLLPFNAVKSVMNAALTLLIYKPITQAFFKLTLTEKKAYNSGNGLRTIILMVSALVVAVIAVLIFVFMIHGQVVAG